MPAILAVMTMILANTFSLTVRERQKEMAVLKVLGFSARRILTLVLGEAALVGPVAMKQFQEGRTHDTVVALLCFAGLIGIEHLDLRPITVRKPVWISTADEQRHRNQHDILR